MTPELHAKLVKALEIGHDLAMSELANVASLYAGYPRDGLGRRITAAEHDVQTINEALTLLKANYDQIQTS